MEEISMIGLDLAKNFIQAHGIVAAGQVLVRKKLRRAQLTPFMASLPPCVVAMEACAGAHHVGRAAMKLGHNPRLIPPAYVKPFVKRGKSDAIDAEALCEAAQRPSMRFVAVKSAPQQAAALVFRSPDLLVRQRTQTINALRGHLTEFGLVAPLGREHMPKLITLIEQTPDAARSILNLLAESIAGLDARIKILDVEIGARAKADATCKRLMSVLE